MGLPSDITQEEMELFLQEADEQLLLLDEDFVALEKAGFDAELIQEIFRAAHTLKGSSAMVGLEKMSQVAHAMETVLDRLRSGQMEVSTPVINALLYGLDALKSLREELVSEEGEGLNVDSVVAELERVASAQDEACSDVIEDEGAADGLWQRLKEALDSGLTLYRVTIEIDPSSSWAAVRCFQALQELSQAGEPLHTVPSAEDIEAGSVGSTLEVILASLQEAAAIRDTLHDVCEIASVSIRPYEPEDMGDVAADQDTGGESGDAGTPAAARAAGKLSHTQQTVRVDVSLLDQMMNLAGEMVIDRTRIGQVGKVLEQRYVGDEAIIELRETSAHMGKVVGELQESVLKARMLPIGTVFNTLPRVVRDLAQRAHKKVDFLIEGRETELDRTIIEQMRDPLLHLLRNAVDHGIEPVSERKAVGKPEKGTIRLSACQEQNHIVIRVQDDGRGIDAEKVKRSTVDKGLIAAEEASRLAVAEVMDLIFAPGVSTAERATEVSGRGVGMDVVRTNIEALGGSVSLESTLGRGTTFTMRLPLTLATINGLLVSSSGTVYVIPMASMVEVLKVEPQEIKTIMGKEVVRLRDNVLPLLRLDREFSNHRAEERDIDGTLVSVVKAGEKAVGLAVDSVMEPQDTVVKPLGKYIGGVRGIAGATILGDGRVALILDTATLVREATGHSTPGCRA
ncbi:MAG: chemotaxis protein CheA [Chloroflexota bacterium]|nr:chemotaxis protein CheA [Chloroflexota bacterium]